ncbi:hypothetical protein [Nostoc sp.]|uniref:hypothetical protein n=1 Tax=Nostoc sp. TaxID=1180 RepID=UPI002FF8C600
MKSLTRIFVALLLAVSITFGSFHSNAHAASASPLPIPSIRINGNTTFDEIAKNIRFDRKYTILVANKTGRTLQRAGVYNDSFTTWPLGDVESNSAVGQQFDGHPITNNFSFASNYRVEPGKNLQLTANFPTIGRRRIGLGNINQDGDSPAKKVWDNMNDSNDKAVNISPFQGRASIQQKDGSIIWYYEVK